ncbi:TetR/AcrR family transcriptional regulator [Bremerella sp. JC770]|uniref:TetR/AcrR family transcriptional regulator n=1 Tax=Bremerella sp. JC770 TaxID=3232137 RepID=UPI003458BD99
MAMHLFWEFGYEAISVAQLQKELGGLSAASFYAAFGSKQSLFEEAMSLYMATCGDIVAPLKDPDVSPREAMGKTLRHAVEVQAGTSHPKGCMAVLAGTNLSAKNREILKMVERARAETRDAIAHCINRAVENHELSKKIDREALVVLFDTFIKGIAIQTRDGISTKALLSSVEILMMTWESLEPGRT